MGLAKQATADSWSEITSPLPISGFLSEIIFPTHSLARRPNDLDFGAAGIFRLFWSADGEDPQRHSGGIEQRRLLSHWLGLEVNLRDVELATDCDFMSVEAKHLDLLEWYSQHAFWNVSNVSALRTAPAIKTCSCCRNSKRNRKVATSAEMAVLSYVWNRHQQGVPE